MMQKRSISLHGHRTSIALEAEFWDEIDNVVAREGTSFAAFITALDDQRMAEKSLKNLASYMRVWVLASVKNSRAK